MENLPRKLNKREARKDGPVLAWFAKHWPKSVAVEVKMKGGKLKPHQEASLGEVADGVFAYKIPDMGRRNPFDGFVLKDADAFVCVCDGNKCECTRINDGKVIHIDL